jgi:hypothetical protein
MGATIRFIYGTEAQILELTPLSDKWVERAFYYPEDRPYFYQALNGVMKKYGSGEDSGIGITLDGRNIGGVKMLIDDNEVLHIPQEWEYNVRRLLVRGIINTFGTINIF